MKKKFLLGIATGMFAVATVFTYNFSNANKAGDVSLNDISIMATAFAESSATTTVKCYKSVFYSGASGYVRECQNCQIRWFGFSGKTESTCNL